MTPLVVDGERSLGRLCLSGGCFAKCGDGGECLKGRSRPSFASVGVSHTL